MADYPIDYGEWGHPDAQDWHGYSDDDVDAAIFGIRNRAHKPARVWYPSVNTVTFAARAIDRRDSLQRAIVREQTIVQDTAPDIFTPTQSRIDAMRRYLDYVAPLPFERTGRLRGKSRFAEEDAERKLSYREW